MSKHIVITGYPRSGTTLLYNMVRGTAVNCESFEQESPAAISVAMDDLNRITKRPLDVFDLDGIVAANARQKELVLLLLIRDVRAVITSIHKSIPTDFFIGFDHCYFVPGEGAPQFINPGMIAFHGATSRAAKDPRFTSLLIRYENLITEPDKLQQYLQDRVGMEFEGLFSDFYKRDIPHHLSYALNGIRPVDRENSSRWRDPQFTARLCSQFTACPALFDVLIRDGYESDRSWYEQEGYTSPCS